jgi:DNA-binding MarR family transcriptional regulator
LKTNLLSVIFSLALKLLSGRVSFHFVNERSGWTFLSNHAHVLVCLARDPDLRESEIADLVGITERTTRGIIADLEEAGVLSITKIGRRNSYEINRKARLRHPLEGNKTVGDLLKSVAK